MEIFRDDCTIAKGKQKNVKKKWSDLIVEKPGEKFYVDISTVAKTSAGWWKKVLGTCGRRPDPSQFLTSKEEWLNS